MKNIIYLMILIIAILGCEDESSVNNEKLEYWTIDDFETGSVTDIDGNTYLTIEIGVQTWMTENLKVTHYGNGEPITKITEYLDWEPADSGAYCGHYYTEDYVAKYGYLYNWYAINDTRGIAPEGWHIPTIEEFRQLKVYLSEGGDTTLALGKLKEGGYENWKEPNTGATNESGFTALPAGVNGAGVTQWVGEQANFWTTSDWSDYRAHTLMLKHEYINYYYSEFTAPKSTGLSVRCIKD